VEADYVPRALIGKLGRAAVVAAIAAVGLGFYVAGREGLWWIIVLAALTAAIVAVVLNWWARRTVRSHPTRAVWLIESGSLLGIIVLGGGITVGFAVLAGYLESVIAVKDDPVSEAVAKTVGGAVAAVGAALVLEDLEKETGTFWPSARTRALFGGTFTHFESATPGYDAVWEERVVRTVGGVSYDVSGWGLRARLLRAKIIASQM
jgi:hypothetical protein